jgi:Asp-tRNA(Asn)/Glu-tRNA(Gln) amidotransferase A subunit family amidase
VARPRATGRRWTSYARPAHRSSRYACRSCRIGRSTRFLFVETAAAFDDLTRSGRDDLMVRQSPDAWPNMFRTARMVPAVEYVQATRMRTRLMRDLDATLDGLDAVITPGRWTSLVALTNYSGHPTLTLRAAVVDGKPRSVTLVGRLYEEGRLIRLGMELERRLDVRDLRPPID